MSHNRSIPEHENSVARLYRLAKARGGTFYLTDLVPTPSQYLLAMEELVDAGIFVAVDARRRLFRMAEQHEPVG